MRSEQTNWSRFAPQHNGNASPMGQMRYFTVKGAYDDSAQALEPGGEIAAHPLVYAWSDSFNANTDQRYMWADTTVEMQIHDPLEQNYVISGEPVLCFLNPLSGTWDVIGSSGLQRDMLSGGAHAGSSGTVKIYPSDVSKYSTSTAPTVTAYHQGIASSGTTSQDIPSGKAWIQYLRGDRKLGTGGNAIQPTMEDGRWIFTDWECPEEETP